MKIYDWSPEKNRLLKSNARRNICFQDIVAAIESGGVLDEVQHPNSDKYPGQRMLVVRAKSYIYGVAYVPTPEGLFLKTVFPSRRLKARYTSKRNP